MENWRKVWYVTVALMLAETVFYLFFGSGQEQHWNKTFEDWINTESPVKESEEKSNKNTA